MSATVELREVHKAYGRTAVVKGLSLSIGAGEFVALLGPSGCGKTTTLRMVAGLERADSGAVSIDSQLVDSRKHFVAPEQRGLGMVFQSYAVWPHRTVEQNVAYPLRIQRMPLDVTGRRVAEALEWVRLTGYGHRMPAELSGGQLQRVAIARALVARPRVLLLDEPLSNLDARLRDELRGEIAGLRARLGTTMIFVTHDQHEALALADRVAVMNAGVIEQIAAPQVIYDAPETPFVAGFVGQANVLEGTIDQGRFTAGPHQFVIHEPPTRGGRCTIAVRPEHVRLDPMAGTAELALTARLFQGHSVEYRLALPSGGTLRALARDRPLLTGASTCVSFERVRCFAHT